MVGVDDVLLAVVGPWVRAGSPQQHVMGRGDVEHAPAYLALRVHGRGVGLTASGTDLDLRGDQLAGDRIREDQVGPRAVTQFLKPAHHAQVRRIENRELLLEPDREVRSLLEVGIPAVEIDVAQAR